MKRPLHVRPPDALPAMPLAIEAALWSAKTMHWRTMLRVVVAGVAVALAGVFQAAAEDKSPAEVVPQVGHSSDVWSVAFSPDGRFALSASTDTTMKLWEIASGKLLRNFTGHAEGVLRWPFHPMAISRCQAATTKR